MNTKTHKKTILCLVLALCSAYALIIGLCLDLRAGIGFVRNVVSLAYFAAVSAGLFFWYRFLFISGIMDEKLRFAVLMAAFLGGNHFIGKLCCFSYSIYDARLYPQYLIALAGFFAFYFALIKALYRFLNTADFHGRPIEKLSAWLSVHTFGRAYVILLIFWLPHLIIKYPSGVCGDAASQIAQCFYSFDTKSPLLHTLLLGGFVKLGRLLGSDNLGIFLFTVVETLVIAAIYSYTVCVMQRMKCRKWTVLATLAFFCLDAYVVFSIGDSIKDVYYTAFFVLFMVMSAQYLFDPESFRASRKSCFLMLTACAGVWLFRNNGKFVIIPMMLVFAAMELRARKSIGKRFIKPALCFVLCIVLPLLANTALAKLTHAEKGPIGEILSLPFQQTARFVKYHGDEVTEEEKQVIDRVLTYSELAEKYNPYLSDPVKNGFRWWAGKGDILNYLKVWAKMFAREPMCYLGAFFEQNYYLFFPDNNNYLYTVDASRCGAYSQFYNIYTPECMERVQHYYIKFIHAVHNLPVIRLFNSMAVDMILIFAMAVCVFNRRDKRQLLLYLPLLISSCVFLGPVIRFHARYVYPCIYSLPLLIGLYTKYPCAIPRTTINEI